jgi:CBS-domain-containing membrane protein
MGAAGAATAVAVTVKSVMGPMPVCVDGDTATIGDVAVLCTAAAHNEPVAVVDGAGRLRRVLRQEDLLEPVRKTGVGRSAEGTKSYGQPR